MITAVSISGFRGVRMGVVEGLGALSVLVGPNGSSKSTILDAVMLAASCDPLGAVRRRAGLRGGARWLFWRGGRSVEPVAQIEFGGSTPRSVKLSLLPDAGLCVDSEPRVLKEAVPVHLVNPSPGGTHAPLWRSFTEAAERGLTREVEAVVRAVVPDLERLQILADDAGLGVLHLGFSDHSIPVDVAGDGIQTLVQVALAMTQPAGSTVLLEEPEATQHPRSLDQSVRAIVAGVKRGVQVILSPEYCTFAARRLGAVGRAPQSETRAVGARRRAASLRQRSLLSED